MRVKAFVAVTVFVGLFMISPRIIPDYLGTKCFEKADSIYRYNVFDEKSKYQKALIYFKLAALLGYNKVESYLGIAACYSELKQYEKAIKYAKKVLAIDPKNDDASGGMVDSLIQLKRYDEAEALALKRLTFIPNKEDAYWELAKIYAAKKEFLKAKKYAIKYRDISDLKHHINDMIISRHILAPLQYALKDYNGVLETLKEIESINPTDPDLFRNYAEIYETMKNYEKALEYYKKVLKFRSNYYPPDYINKVKKKIKILESKLQKTE